MLWCATKEEAISNFSARNTALILQTLIKTVLDAISSRLSGDFSAIPAGQASPTHP